MACFKEGKHTLFFYRCCNAKCTATPMTSIYKSNKEALKAWNTQDTKQKGKDSKMMVDYNDDQPVQFKVMVIEENERAIKVHFLIEDVVEWLPKSQVAMDYFVMNKPTTLMIPTWLAQERGLI